MKGEARKKRELLELRHLSQSDATEILFYVFMALASGGRGFVLISIENVEILQSEWYMALHVFMDIRMWGAILIFFSILLLVSALLAPKPAVVFTILSNTVLGVTFIFLSGAALEHSESLWTFYIHLLLAVAHSMLAANAGYWLWIKKKNTNT